MQLALIAQMFCQLSMLRNENNGTHFTDKKLRTGIESISMQQIFKVLQVYSPSQSRVI